MAPVTRRPSVQGPAKVPESSTTGRSSHPGWLVASTIVPALTAGSGACGQMTQGGEPGIAKRMSSSPGVSPATRSASRRLQWLAVQAPSSASDFVLTTSSASTHAPSTQVMALGHAPQVPPQGFGPHSSSSQAQAAHCWSAVQAIPTGHSPHSPPQPSGPQALPSQPQARQRPSSHHSPRAHSPQVAPQPSEPHTRPSQTVKTHLPSAQTSPQVGHPPHEPPHPSEPQCFQAGQLGVQQVPT